MGYRSDVFIAIKKEAYEQEMLLGIGRDEGFHNAARLNEKDVYYWSFEGTKWSDSYPECAYVINLIDSIALSEGGEDKFAFARTGEDGEDTEEMGNLDAFNITVVQYQSAYIDFAYDSSYTILNTPTIGAQNATAAA